MLEITEQQMAVFERASAQRGIEPVVACMYDVHPDWRLVAPPAQLRQRAADWIAYAQRFRVLSVVNICTLYELEQRWGGFSDPSADWIIEVLQGPLAEDGKIAYLDEMLHGG